MPDDPVELKRFDYLRADPIAWSMRCEGFALAALEDVVERAAIYEHDAGMGEIAATIQAAGDVLDRMPEARRWHAGHAPMTAAKVAA